MGEKEFWDGRYAAKNSTARYGSYGYLSLNDSVLNAALKHFGNVKGKTVLDIGCGIGITSLFFAHHGANVISIDTSDTAIQRLEDYCAQHTIKNIRPLLLSANEVEQVGAVDFCVGTMILHHIEPFSEFAISLKAILGHNGKAFFRENSANNRFLIWCRQHLVGRYGIPKFGDQDEFPFTPQEIDDLRKHFDVRVEYADLHLIRMISTYLLGGRFLHPFIKLDNYLYRFESLRKYSYRQHIYLASRL